MTDSSRPRSACRRQRAKQQRRHDHHQQRIEREEHRRADLDAADHPVDVVAHPQRDGVADLLVGAAEHGDRKADAEQQQERVAAAMRRGASRTTGAPRALFAGQVALPVEIDQRGRRACRRPPRAKP